MWQIPEKPYRSLDCQCHRKMWQSFTEWLFTIMKCLIRNDGKRHRNISVSGQLLETFWLLIIFQPMFIAQISGLHHSIARCLVSLETKFQFCDAFRHRITVKILEHVISELSDNETNYWTALLSWGRIIGQATKFFL